MMLTVQAQHRVMIRHSTDNICVYVELDNYIATTEAF